MTMTDEGKMHTYAEAAERIGMSESWLRKQGAKETVPLHRLGRSVHFSESDIQEILARAKVVPRTNSYRKRRQRRETE
jgi:predicted DNA-binding transcriptional regulator AlpA